MYSPPRASCLSQGEARRSYATGNCLSFFFRYRHPPSPSSPSPWLDRDLENSDSED